MWNVLIFKYTCIHIHSFSVIAAVTLYYYIHVIIVPTVVTSDNQGRRIPYHDPQSLHGESAAAPKHELPGTRNVDKANI